MREGDVIERFVRGGGGSRHGSWCRGGLLYDAQPSLLFLLVVSIIAVGGRVSCFFRVATHDLEFCNWRVFDAVFAGFLWFCWSGY